MMLGAICSKCGTSRDDLVAVDVWDWFDNHVCDRIPPPVRPRARPWERQPCGTRGAYDRGCRCDDCRQALRDYERAGQQGSGCVVTDLLIDHVAIAGLDCSTKRIGYAAPNGTLHSIQPDKICPSPSPVDLARRCNQLRTRLARTIRINPPIPTFIVIEGAFYSHPKTSARLDELRGVIRDLLYGWPEPHGPIEFVEVPPRSLKLFATGKGGADKSVMTHAATCRMLAADPHGFGPGNDDEADAWHLRNMGRVAHGLDEALADYQSDAISECGVLF